MELFQCRVLQNISSSNVALNTGLGMRFCREKVFLSGYFMGQLITRSWFRFSLPGAHNIELRSSTWDGPDWRISLRASKINLIRGWINDDYEESRVAPGVETLYRFADGTATLRMACRWHLSARGVYSSPIQLWEGEDDLFLSLSWFTSWKAAPLQKPSPLSDGTYIV